MVAGPFSGEGGDGGRVRNHGDRKQGFGHLDHGEADAVDCDGALFNDAPQKFGRGANREYQRISLGAHGVQGTDPVNVPAHKVAAEATRCRESALQIDKAACAQFSEIRAMQGFRHDIGGKALSGKSAHG